MPNGVFVNGKKTYTPGTFVDVNADGLNGGIPGTNALAIVGSFPEFEPAKPYRFNNPDQIRARSVDQELLNLLHHIYNPSTSTDVTSAPDHGYIVNAADGTQASTALALSSPAGAVSLSLKSRIWGTLGNTGTVAVTASGANRTITISVNGISETVQLDSVPLGTISYTGTDATAATADIRDTSTSKLTILQTRSAIASGALALATSSWKWDGIPTFVASGSGNHSLSVSGIRKDTGAAFTSTLTFTGSTTPVAGLAFAVSAITALTWTPAASETLTVSGAAFDLDLTSSTFRTVKNVADHINAYASQGWEFVVESPKIGSIPSIQLDSVASATIVSPATMTATADLPNLLSQISGSSLVEATEPVWASVKTKTPAAFSGVQSFAGGTFSAADTTSVSAAYLELENAYKYTPTCVLHALDDLGSQQLWAAHIRKMNGIGQSPRMGFSYLAANTAKSAILTRVNAMVGPQYVQFAAQEVESVSHTGELAWRSPLYQAAMYAGIRTGTPVGTSLTSKNIIARNIRNSTTWSASSDSDEMLQAYGITFCRVTSSGPTIVRDVTAFLENENPVLSAGGAMDSLTNTIRALRIYLSDRHIGKPAGATRAKLIEVDTRTVLTELVNIGWCKGYLGNSVKVEDVGNFYNVHVAIAPLESVEFTLISVNVVRISSSV